MRYIVLDLEWNQALSKEAANARGFHLAGEIIQIGAVRLGEDRRAEDTFRRVVAPKIYKKMHWSVRKLTGISTQSLADGMAFPDAYEEFLAWCGGDFALLTWGPDDVPMLLSNLRLHKIPAPDPLPVYDLQRIYSRTVSGEKKRCSLADALARLEITDVCPPHDALNDALNTARICEKIDLDDAVAHYGDPVKLAAEPPQLPPGEIKEYASLEEMEAEDPTAGAVCPECGAPLAFGRWLRRAPGKKTAGAACGCGKIFMLRLRWYTDEDTGRVTSVRSLDESGEEQWASYQKHLHRRRPRRRRSSKKKAASEPAAPASAE